VVGGFFMVAAEGFDFTKVFIALPGLNFGIFLVMMNFL